MSTQKVFTEMTLRDYFAAAALGAIVHGPHWDKWQTDDSDAAGTAAMVAYECADAMLIQRETP